MLPYKKDKKHWKNIELTKKHKNHFQNVDKTKFHITYNLDYTFFSFTQIRVMQKWVHPTTKTTKSSTLYGLHDF